MASTFGESSVPAAYRREGSLAWVRHRCRRLRPFAAHSCGVRRACCST